MPTTWTTTDGAKYDALSDDELIRLAGDPPPLTTEQRAIAALDRRQALKTAKRATARSATLGFIALFLGLSGAVYVQQLDNRNAREALKQSATDVAVTRCNSIFRERLRQRKALVSLDFKITPAQAQRVVFLPDCRAAERTLTDDPNEVNIPPEPLYPGK